MMVLKLSFPVILIDELLKFVARTYLEGKLKEEPAQQLSFYRSILITFKYLHIMDIFERNRLR